jgi:pimeloyl-ACP methyl ester carboxylesterase
MSSWAAPVADPYAAAPLPAAARRRRVVRGIGLIGMGLLGPPVPVVVMITLGDWRAPSEGGWGKLLAIGVLVTVLAGAGALIDGTRCIRQARVAAGPGEFVDAVPFEGTRRQRTSNLFFNRWQTVQRCGVDLFGVDDEVRSRPMLSLEVDRRELDRVASQVVVLYGALDGSDRYVLAAQDGVVWETTTLLQ